MRTIALLTFCAMCTTCKYNITSLLVVLALDNTRVHIYFLNHYDIMAYIKAFINETFCICAVL